MSEPTLECVSGSFTVCSACLDGEGGECHTPGCVLWLNRAPDLSLREGLTMHGCRIGPSAAPAPGTPAPEPQTICSACGGNAGAKCHATVTMKVTTSGADEDPRATPMDYRLRCFALTKWLSRLLGIGMNQVGDEADRRWDHPLGKDEAWTGTQAEWIRANVRILEGARARLLANVRALEMNPAAGCQCAECRGETVDLDAPAPAPGTPARTPPSDAEPNLNALAREADDRGTSL